LNMLELVDAYLQDAGLYDGWTSQLQFWNDTGDGSEQFIVLQSNGGTQVMDGIGGDFYFSCNSRYLLRQLQKYMWLIGMSLQSARYHHPPPTTQP
jgi:hypothetical protein